MRKLIHNLMIGIGCGAVIVIYTVIAENHPDFAKADTKVEKTETAKNKQVCNCKEKCP